MGIVLHFRNGHRVTLVDQGVDDRGAYLRLRHHLPTPGREAGPHWHPELTESWTVRHGQARFRIDGAETIAVQGDAAHAKAGAVHEFWTEAPDTVLDHEIRPPLRHWQMFQLWQALDAAGTTTRAGVPRNPLALALLWKYQDGYIAYVPLWLQRLFLGGLARLAHRTGYEERWLPA
ncbi:cupin domain-containing protein [Nocardia araoensis]|uniref:cupin domain-containing protein n=1 Tax=Nocardia araoensis TaxID=228600 RepID=UPI0002D5E525|nr:cupin domain-containing protein [Nocardia araoensis]